VCVCVCVCVIELLFSLLFAPNGCWFGFKPTKMNEVKMTTHTESKQKLGRCFKVLKQILSVKKEPSLLRTESADFRTSQSPSVRGSRIQKIQP
jgi:hypothetical protein